MLKHKAYHYIFWIVIAALSFVFIYNAVSVVQHLEDYNTAMTEYSSLDMYGPKQNFDFKKNKIKADDLYAINNDFVGWIVVPGTNINYPIVRGRDNYFYLHHSFKKKVNSSGAIFLDYRSAKDFSDFNSLIYGHHMRNQTMFAQINKFKDLKFFNNHPYAYLYTSDKTYRLEVFSAYILCKKDNEVRFNFKSAQNFLNYIVQIKKFSTNYRDLPFGKNDRIITLSTCTYEYDNARYIVHLKVLKN